jgi:hydrogenase nickel incorporation protein HypB
MCGYCGCGEPAENGPSQRASKPAPPTGGPGQDQGPDHHHHHEHEGERVLELSRHVLDKNARLAERVRGILLAKGICAINLVSSPGSGKTRLLETSLRQLVERGVRVAVLVGDLATDNDAQRLRTTGVQAVQITTGNVCHLDAHMVLHGFESLDLNAIDVVFFENVGNLVCPASFDLGEDLRVVLTSVTEGEDKPHKYPTIFDGARLALITKTDLSEAVEVDLPALRTAIEDVAPGADILELSAKTGQGLEPWLARVESELAAKRSRAL